MDIDVERLKVDAAYWDEVAKPWATHFDPFLENWIDYKGGWLGIIHVSDDSEVWRTREGVLPRGAIPRPSQWSDDGLPPVGAMCEVRHPRGWRKAQIACYVRDSKNIFAVYQFGDDINALDDWSASTADYFRPLKTDKERAVEAALIELSLVAGFHDRDREVAEALYDAGLLTIPNA